MLIKEQKEGNGDIMTWEDVLKKFGEKQTPRKPYESKEAYYK